MALLDKSPRSASAQAKTDCVLVQVSEQGYQQLLAELPVWAQGMLKSFALRLQHMNQLLIELPQFISSSNKK
jgi:CRP-like cAMP-binding protein